MDVNIALLAGDGIGPEIIAEATKVLDRVAAKFGHRFDYREALVGACAIDATGDPYPDETHAICQAADAVLFGAIGDPKYDNDPKAPVRPEQGLLRMRKSLGLFANLRPIALFDTLASRSPLKAEVVRGTDFICVRELTSGIYFGRPQGRNEAPAAPDGRGQGQRARNLAPVAGGRAGYGAPVPRSGAGIHVRGQRRDADRTPADPFRRDRHREHVRRHPHRRGQSRSTAPIRRLRGRTSPTRWPRSSRPPCCSNTWGSTRRAAPCGPP